MASSSKPFRSATLTGTIYRWDKGDGLPLHSHGKLDTHCTIVARGSVLIEGANIPNGSVTIKAGGACDFGVGCEHAITALEDRTVVYNIANRYYMGKEALDDAAPRC